MFRNAQVDAGPGGVLAQAMRDEISVLYDGLELGYASARLDTGPKQIHARSLYESEGYLEIADFNGNPVAAFWGEKPL